MTRLRFLVLFALTNTLLIAGVAAVSAGGTVAVLVGVPCAVLAVIGVVLLARVVVATAPAEPRVSRADVKRLKKELR